MPAQTEKQKPSGKKAAPLTPEEQRRRFEEAARELGSDASEERFNEALDVIGRHKARANVPEPEEARIAKPSAKL